MTITITRYKLALSVLVAVLIGTGIASASDNDNPFDDVPDVGASDEAFFSAPVEWLWDNGLTTGTSATTFSPNDGVTRGEYATFNFRYDDKIVQPALAALQAEIDTAETSIATNTANVATNTAAINALEGPQSVTVIIGGAAFSGEGGSDVFTSGCQYNSGGGEMRAGLSLPLGATITSFGGHLIGTGSALQLVRTTTSVSTLETITTATAPLDLETADLATPEVVEAGEYFSLEWEPDASGGSDQVCGAQVTYTIGEGLLGLSEPQVAEGGVPAGE